MSEKALLALGADCVGGDLILGHQVVGHYRDGDFSMTDAGRAAITVEAAEDKPVKARKSKAAAADAGDSQAPESTDAA